MVGVALIHVLVLQDLQESTPYQEPMIFFVCMYHGIVCTGYRYSIYSIGTHRLMPW